MPKLGKLKSRTQPKGYVPLSEKSISALTDSAECLFDTTDYDIRVVKSEELNASSPKPFFDTSEYEARIEQAAALQKQREKEQFERNAASRLTEISRFTGGVARSAWDGTHLRAQTPDYPIENDFELEIGALLGGGSGLLLALGIHYLFRGKYKNHRSLNPAYRVLKTMASVGASVSTVIMTFFPFPKALSPVKTFLSIIIADIVSLSLGLIVAPIYYIIRHHILKIDPNSTETRNTTLAKVGTNNGWSKYGKAALMYGIALGQVIGALAAAFSKRVLEPAQMMIYGAIAGITAFVASLILVPLINKFCSKFLIRKNKNDFRSDYTRSGITLGLALGSCLGALLGTFLLPGIGTMAGLMLGGAIGSLIGGAAFSIYGSRISNHIQQNWNKAVDTDNSWDYTTRNCAYVLGFLGTGLGILFTLLSPLPLLSGIAGITAGAAIGSAVGSAIGWVCGLVIIKQARARQAHEILVTDLPNLLNEEKHASTLPWTQRVANAANICSTLGLILGFGIGFALGGPFGAVVGALAGAGFCGFIGGIIGSQQKRSAITAAEHEFNRRFNVPPSLEPEPKPDPTPSNDDDNNNDKKPLLIKPIPFSKIEKTALSIIKPIPLAPVPADKTASPLSSRTPSPEALRSASVEPNPATQIEKVQATQIKQPAPQYTKRYFQQLISKRNTAPNASQASKMTVYAYETTPNTLKRTL